MRVSKLKMHKVVIPILDEFFTVGECEGETVLYQKKLKKVHKHAVDLHKKRRAAGRKGGLKSLKGNDQPQAELKPSPSSASVLLKHLDYTKTNTKTNHLPTLEKQGVAEAKEDFMAVGLKVLDLAGLDAARFGGSYNPVRSWLAAGYEPDQIYCAVKSVAENRNYSPPSSLNYFSSAVARKAAQANKEAGRTTDGWNGTDVRNHVEEFRRSGWWPSYAGPSPEKDGFLWPDLLKAAEAK